MFTVPLRDAINLLRWHAYGDGQFSDCACELVTSPRDERQTLWTLHASSVGTRASWHEVVAHRVRDDVRRDESDFSRVHFSTRRVYRDDLYFGVFAPIFFYCRLDPCSRA